MHTDTGFAAIVEAGVGGTLQDGELAMSRYVEDTMKNSSSIASTCALAVAAVSGACNSSAVDNHKVHVKTGDELSHCKLQRVTLIQHSWASVVEANQNELSNHLPSSFVVASCVVRACCTGSCTHIIDCRPLR